MDHRYDNKILSIRLWMLLMNDDDNKCVWVIILPEKNIIGHTEQKKKRTVKKIK